MTTPREIDRFKDPIVEAIAQAFYSLPRDEYLALLEEIRDEAIAPEIVIIEAERRAELLAMCADGEED